MPIDHAGKRVIQLARIGADIVCALAILGAIFLLVQVVSDLVWGHGAPVVALFPLAAAMLVFAGAWGIRALLRDVLAGAVFTLDNARRIARVGWLLIAFAAVRALLPMLGALAGGGRQGVVVLLLALVQPAVFTGLLVLAIASAWRYGVELQNERDLTI